jgi:peptidyl-prolyl cis-trans isomerase SurA
MKKIFLLIGVLILLEPAAAILELSSKLGCEALARQGSLAKKGDATTVDGIVAVVDDEVITKSELNVVLFSVYGEYKKSYSGQQLIRKMDEARRDILNQMIEEKLIINAAKQTDIEVTDKEVDEKIEDLKKRFNSEQEFINALKDQGVTIRDLRKRFRQEILKSKLVDSEVKRGITVSFKEISDYYHSHPGDFNSPEMVRVSSILVKPESDEPQDWATALVRVGEILSKLDNNAKFEDLVEQYSQGLHAEEKGDMGFIARGHMLKEIDDIIFNLKLGQVSLPVKTKLGYYIFKLQDRRPASVVKLEDAQNKIKAIIFTDKFRVKFKKWIEDLKQDAYISIK